MIYIPMTCDILTPGHIKCLEWLVKKDKVVIGLLTEKALRGYKHAIMSYEDRYYILDTITYALGNCQVVPQDSLDPSGNLKKYKCDTIASGDGWEPQEIRAVNKLGVKTLDIRLHGEKTKKYSSSLLKSKIKSQNFEHTTN